MQLQQQKTLASLFLLSVISVRMMGAEEKNSRYQYRFRKIVIPAASADEPTRSRFSLKPALDYIEDGARAWSKEKMRDLSHQWDLHGDPTIPHSVHRKAPFGNERFLCPAVQRDEAAERISTGKTALRNSSHPNGLHCRWAGGMGYAHWKTALSGNRRGFAD